MKFIRLIENLLLIFSMNLAWFFTTYYQHRIDGSYSLADIVFDLLFTVMITWLFVIIFAKNKTVFSEGAFRLQGYKRSILFKWLVLIIVKCAFDIAVWSFGIISVEWKYLGIGLLSGAFWLIGYVFLAQKDVAIWENKRKLLILSGFVFVVLAIGVCYDLHLISQTHLLTVKYREDSPYLIRACKNMDFFSSVKTFIIDMVILFALVIFHMTHAPLTKKEQEKKSNIVQMFVRCDIILALFLILCVIKTAIDPQGILLMKTSEPYSRKNYEKEGPFDLTIENEMVLYGFDIEPSSDRSYYYVEKVSLQKGHYEFEQFVGNGEDSICVFTDKGKRGVEYVEFSIGERKVYLYGHYAICYYENGVTPRIIRIDSLNQCENNAIVTELCKHLIEEGNLFAFEYAGEYLAKYEPEFIRPYIEKYSAGLFNVAETRWMEEAYYRSDYIVDLAKQFS
jgi:hypothetical protein